MGGGTIILKTAIIIVTFNRMELLKECILHGMNQLNQDVELIVVNNASTDGTKKYLDETYNNSKIVHVLNLPENIGGAGGFARGLQFAFKKTRCEMFLLIDDDAMIEVDYLEKIYKFVNKGYEAYSGSVIVNGNIDISHRLLFDKGKVPINYYEKPFECDIATFCGLIVTRKIVKQIGFPREDFFIWNDDTEYCYRISKYSRILNVSNAQLNHKTSFVVTKNKNLKDSWKEYYGIRNNLLIYKLNHKYGKMIKKILSCIYKAIIFKVMASHKKENSEAYLYNSNLRMNAVKDFLFNNMGKNDEYMP